MDALAKVCPKCGRRYDTGATFCQTDGVRLQLTDEQADPYIGHTLLDQFKIEEKIGAGGMGTVYRARQTTLHRDVAIKILHPELADNRDAVRRFKREARVCTALDHPNVVRVFLFGQLEDGSLYIVMEYLRGRSLLEVIQQEGALPVHRAVHIAAQICDGVGEAHGQGVVHRDLKPENVVLVQRARDPDVVKVLDFGIARVLWGDDQTVATQSGLVFGTARYISPEGAAGEATDARSDVYSLGIITYQLLCGRTPFDAPSPVGMLMKHIHSSPPHLRSQREARHVPSPIADVVMRALSKNPEGRYEDAHHFAEALRGAAEGAGFEPYGRAGRPPSGRVASARGRRRAGREPPLASDPPPFEVPPFEAPLLETPPRQAPPREARSAAGHRAGAEPTPSMQQASPTPTLSRPPVESETLAGAPSPFGDEADDLEVPGLGRPRPGPSPRVTRALGLAFVVGALLVGGGFGVSRWLEARAAEPAVDVDLLAAQAQEALGAGRYDAPAEDSVRGLTDRILEARPGDARALRLRREAAERLARQAQGAEGDEARALYSRALRLVPDDAAIQAALEALDAPPEPPPTPGVRTRPGHVVEDESVTLVAVLGPDVEVGERERPRFLIRRGGRAVGRAIDARPDEDGLRYVAQHTFRRPGEHTVVFRIGRGPDRVQDEATVDVARDPSRPRRPPQDRDPPPVTTQGSAWTPTLAPAWSPTSGGGAPSSASGGSPTPGPAAANPTAASSTTTGSTTSSPAPAPSPPEPSPPPPPAPWTGGSVL